MEFSTRLIKYILIGLNVVFVVCGIVLIAIGIVILVQESKGLDSFTDFSVGGFAVAVGGIIFLISSFGCFGAYKENNCLLTTYAALLIVLFILQVGFGVLAFVVVQNKAGLRDQIREIVRKVFREEDQDVIDDIQQWFECCGVEGSSYWTDELFVWVPSSCCEDNDCLNNHPYSRGCVTAFQDVMTYYIIVIGIVAIVFAALEVLGAIFAYVVRKKISYDGY